MRFTDRKDAGLRLADKLLLHPKIVQSDCENLLILSIPRGGVIIGDTIARVLGCNHDILIVKKISFPGNEEQAIGAIAENGTVMLNREIISWGNITPDEVQDAIAKARTKVEYYVRTLRRGKALDIANKTIILVDDGVATGETLKAAICWLNAENHLVQHLIVAIPVCSPNTLKELEILIDEIICLYVPENFHAVGQFYQNFEPVSEEEVLHILYGQEK